MARVVEHPFKEGIKRILEQHFYSLVADKFVLVMEKQLYDTEDVYKMLKNNLIVVEVHYQEGDTKEFVCDLYGWESKKRTEARLLTGISDAFKAGKFGSDWKKKGKKIGEEILARQLLKDIEVFPKQGEAKGLGSLIRLPFGVHRKSERVYPFVGLDGLPIAPTIREQIATLANAKTVPNELIEEYTSTSSKTIEKAPYIGSGVVWGEIKQALPIVEFIGRYIELTPTPTGGLGYCPFHRDEHPSFGVHGKGNYWHCFAGCGGGSVIDFWMLWKNIEFKEAVNQLREQLEREEK